MWNKVLWLVQIEGLRGAWSFFFFFLADIDVSGYWAGLSILLLFRGSSMVTANIL